MDAKEKMYKALKQIQFGIELGTTTLSVMDGSGKQDLVKTLQLLSEIHYAMVLFETEIEK